MQLELKATDDWAVIVEEQDPIALLKAIKSITYSFCDQQYLPGNVWKGYKLLFNIVQKEGEDLKTFYERYINQVEVIENYVGAITIADFMYETDPYSRLTTNKLKEENITKAKGNVREQLLAYGLLSNLDKRQYGSLVEDLDNAHTFGDDKYPRTQQRAYEYALNYKKYTPKKQSNEARQDGLLFTTQGRGGRGNGNGGCGGRGGRGGHGPRRCFGEQRWGNCDNSSCPANNLDVSNANIDTNNNNNDNNGNNNNDTNSQGSHVQGLTINMDNYEEEHPVANFSFYSHTKIKGVNMVDNNENKPYIFKQNNKNESTKNLNRWLLLDSGSTTHLISNNKLVNNISPSNSTQGVISNGGELEIYEEANLDGIGTVPYSNEGIANLLSMAKLVDKGFRVQMDTAIEDAIRVHTNDGRVIKFKRSNNGLYFHDTANRQMAFMNSQYENAQLYTQRQIRRAKAARDLYQMIGYPSLNDYKNAIKYNMIKNCPVTIDNINVAEDIFGKDIYALKGKTIQRAPF